MFKKIYTINNVQPKLYGKVCQKSGKPYFNFDLLPNGATVGSYHHGTPASAFDCQEALECRGIVFDKDGFIASRPVHKFFNMHEKDHLSFDVVSLRDDVHAVYEELDGCMVATSWIDGKMKWRTMGSFDSEELNLLRDYFDAYDRWDVNDFAWRIAELGLTAVFDFIHPKKPIVIKYNKPSLTLLHIRDNVTGEYVMIANEHPMHNYVVSLIDAYNIETAKTYFDDEIKRGINPIPLAVKSLNEMKDREGYVVQFKNGDMLKLKCKWYLSKHKYKFIDRDITVAEIILDNNLDDMRPMLSEIGYGDSRISRIDLLMHHKMDEARHHANLAYKAHGHLPRKEFVSIYKDSPYLRLMGRLIDGKDLDADYMRAWYRKHRLKIDFK